MHYSQTCFNILSKSSNKTFCLAIHIFVFIACRLIILFTKKKWKGLRISHIRAQNSCLLIYLLSFDYDFGVQVQHANELRSLIQVEIEKCQWKLCCKGKIYSWIMLVTSVFSFTEISCCTTNSSQTQICLLSYVYDTSYLLCTYGAYFQKINEYLINFCLFYCSA